MKRYGVDAGSITSTCRGISNTRGHYGSSKHFEPGFLEIDGDIVITVSDISLW